MAFDGIVVAALAKELNEALSEGRIYKIAQPERDEIFLTVRRGKEQRGLLISAGAGLPLVYLTDQKKTGPMEAPNFCMLLRKHMQNGRIVRVSQPGLERVLVLEVEHRNELGDLCIRKLIVEIMGKHSNIIFCDADDTILDSIKHISANVSSVREVLPGRTWFIPDTMGKTDPLTVTKEAFRTLLEGRPGPVSKELYMTFTGVSPVMAQDICAQGELDPDIPYGSMGEVERIHLYGCFSRTMERVRKGDFAPCLVYEEDQVAEFSALPLHQYRQEQIRYMDSMSRVLSDYYAEKNVISRIRQRSADLRRIVQTTLERDVKKYDLQLRQMKDTEKMDKYRLYGELLHTYGYSAAPGARKLECVNYYDGQPVTIPLDPQLTAAENAGRFFDRYGKLKRTREALTQLLAETKEEIDHLESVSRSLDTARTEGDLEQIREELVIAGYIRRRDGRKKQRQAVSRPWHYISSDGFDIYVGKNNLQNEEITFHLAEGSDWWFHAKDMPGSHVIVKCRGEEPPDRTFEEAASLAAYHSRGEGNAEVDYVQRKHVKKPNGAKPGFVVYYTNYSMVPTGDLSGVTLAEE